MADIAILVAEEYERRVKKSRKNGEEIDLMSCVGFLGKNLKGIKEQKVVFESGFLGKGAVLLQPKSQLSLAASYGFFSA